MGCDIHLFIEYKRKDNEFWFNWGQKFRLDRDYRMFSKLAGVRNYQGSAQPVSEPRGLPDNIGWRTRDENRLSISDEPERSEPTVSPEDAKRWVESGSSTYQQGESYVTHPDWHSHSWLTFSEYSQCVQQVSELSVEYKAVLAAMESLQDGGYDVRVVFWFDN